MAQQNPSTPSSPVRTLPPVVQSQKPSTPPGKGRGAGKSLGATPFWIGLVLSVSWFGVVLIIIAKSGPGHTFGGIPLINWALGVSATVSPVALVWMVTAYMQRATDIQTIADPLRRQLTMITGESGAAEARIRRFNQAIREQLELLRSAQDIGQSDLAAVMDRVRQHRNDLERFEHSSVHQVKEIQEVIRRNMQHVEHMMDDKFTMLRILDEKMVKNSDGVARQTEAIRAQTEEMLKEIDSVTGNLAESLDRSLRDTRKLSETSRMQESNLMAAAESAAETLNGVSSRIDFSIAHFLERAGSAREEAERLAGALDAQTRSLDEFSNTLPARVSEAESVMRGVADRLYASEQMAREQAVNLSDRLSQQVEGLNAFMNQFGARLADIDKNLGDRTSDLGSLVGRIDTTADQFSSAWEKSISGFSERADNALLRFTVINDESRRNVEQISAHLNETTAKYEDAAIKVSSISKDGSTNLSSINTEIGRYLTQFEALRDASQQAGEEVQARSAAAVQNLQYVLERLLAAREATQSVGANLTKDLHAAVDHNEQLIIRLNEASQMSVRALAIASETLGKKEGEMSTQARSAEAMLREAAAQLQTQAMASEKGLREQAAGLMGLLAEIQSQMITTDQKLRGFATQAMAPVQQALQGIDATTEKGMQAIGSYGEGVQEQLNRLQQFNGRIGDMSGELGRVTVETVASIETLNTRFASVRASQEETAKHTMAQFVDFAERLQRESAGLDATASQAAESLQQAAIRVGEQSYKLLQDTQNSGAQMQMVTGALQVEASQIRSILQKQTDDLGADLSRAEKQFTTLGDALKQRTDSAYALLDRVATHYNDVTRTTSQDLEARAQRLETATMQAQEKVVTLNSALENSLTQIDSGTTQLETHATQITGFSGKTLQQLASVNEKLALTHEAANSNAQQALSRLEECNTAFLRQSNSLSDAAQNSATLVQRAGTAFGEQAGKMMETTAQMDQSVRQLSATTTAMADQSAQIRVNMEQQSQRLLSQLGDAVTQLESTSGKLHQSVIAAGSGADQVAARFTEMTQVASSKLNASHDEMKTVASDAQTTLSAIGSTINQQAASLSVLGEQLDSQHRTMFAANENQRTQLIDLFEKLGGAHAQASDVAERTIVRLNESLQQIQRQLGGLSDQSQAAIGNVREATIGFADQAGTLLQNANAAEQQARTVLSVTAALQDQVRDLRETLHGEGERTQDILSSLLGRITAGGSEVRELGTNTELTLTSLQNSLTQQTGALNTMMGQIGERQRSLTIALDAQRDVINGLLNRLALAQDETANTTERLVVRLSENADKVERQIEQLDTKTQITLATIQTATSSLADQSGMLAQNVTQTEQQARSAVSAATALQEQARGMRESLQAESERTNDTLNSLLTRLAAGDTQLRNLGSAAEANLNSLNDQASGVGLTMQQIMERQRMLTSALAEQREMMNSLLNRMTLAQDETAAVTERTVNRLTDGSQQITRQIEAIGSQAQLTLANIQAVNAGFADESGVLTLQAHQAEQQMRGVLTVTAAMQDQARQIRETMQMETTRMIEQLTGVIGQLDSTTNQLKMQSGSAISSMDQVAMQFGSMTRSSTEAMQSQAVALSEAAETAENRMTGVSEKIRTQLKLVGEASGSAEQQARQVADSAEYAVTKLVTLRDSLVVTNKDGKQVLDDSSVRIEDVRATLSAEIERLTTLSQEAVQQVSSASTLLGTQSDVLRANLASSESALIEATTNVRHESNQLPTIIERSTTAIEGAAKLMHDKSIEAETMLVGTADRFIAVTTTARESMADEMRRISLVADNAAKILTQFNTGLTAQVDALQQSTATMSTEQKDMVARANDSVAQLTAAAERLTDVRADAANTAERLSREFDMLDQRASATGQRLVSASDSVTKTMDALAQATERAEGQMLGASSGFREQLERIRTGVQGQIDDINRGLMQITAQLERTGSTLRSTTAGTVADVERISQRFDQTSKEASVQLGDKTVRMRAVTEEVGHLLSGFGDQFDVLLDRLSVAGDGIRRHEGDLIGQLQSALTHLDGVTEKLEHGRTLATDVSAQTVDRLTEVVNTVQQQMQGLTTGSQTAAGIMRGIGQIYSDQSDKLNRGVTDAHSQVQLMHKSIDDMQARTDRMRMSLKAQSEELMNSLQQIMDQISANGDTLSETPVLENRNVI